MLWANERVEHIRIGGSAFVKGPRHGLRELSAVKSQAVARRCSIEANDAGCFESAKCDGSWSNADQAVVVHPQVDRLTSDWDRDEGLSVWIDDGELVDR